MPTPDQRAFLAACCPELDPDGWHATTAGRAGSQREFRRVRHPGLAAPRILVVWDSSDPDWPYFLGIAADLAPATDALPVIYGHDADLGLILVEDLGTFTLKQWCRDQPVAPTYTRTIDALARWHAIPPITSITLCRRRMDRDMWLWESAYFAAHCVRTHAGKGDLLDDAWEAERRALADAVDALPTVCLHRDFQSENIMVTADRIRWVDFQGARLGPAAYDLASLLGDPYAPWLTPELVSRLLARYREHVSMELQPTVDDRAYHLCAAQRLMQALGAYGNLAYNKGMRRYLDFIPLALDRLAHTLGQLPDYPRLHSLVASLRRLHRSP